MRFTAIMLGLPLSISTLAQTQPLTLVLSSTTPPDGGPAITSTPVVDVSPDGIVAISDRAFFPRNVYLAEPGGQFTRFAQYGFRATMPDGQEFGVNFGGGWAGRLPGVGPAFFGSDQEIGLVGAVVGQTATPFFWTDQQLPGQPAGLKTAWGRFDKFAVSNSGVIAAAARLAGPGVTTLNDFSILRSSDTGPVLAFRSGSDPLNRPGVAFTNRDFSNDFAINDSGTIVFSALHLRNGAPVGPAVLITDGTVVRVLLDQDTPMPGFPVQARLSRLSVSLGINTRGDVAFAGMSVQTPGTALFGTHDGVLRAVYVFGGPIEGVPSELTPSLNFDALGAICPINDFGDIAFHIRLIGPGVTAQTDTALCVYRADGTGGGRVMLVAREGDSVPGTSRRVGDFSAFDTAVYFNARRQVVFAAGGGPSTRSMYFWSPSRGVRLLAGPGDSVTLDGTPTPITAIPGVTQEQRGNYWLRATGGADGRRTILSDSGEVFIWATFAQDRGGLFRTILPPECLADFNADGFVDGFDYAAFVAAFEDGHVDSDANGDGFLDFFDYGRFVEVFEEGC
jgi:hypothetical protein